MTAADLKITLSRHFPGVDFHVRAGSYARGTNSGRDVLEVKYNYKLSPIDPDQIEPHLPQHATLWAVGKKN